VDKHIFKAAFLINTLEVFRGVYKFNFTFIQKIINDKDNKKKPKNNTLFRITHIYIAGCESLRKKYSSWKRQILD